MIDKLKNYFLDIIVVRYLSDFLKRLDGYKTLLGFVLTVVQVLAEMLTSPESMGVFAVLIKVLSNVAQGQLDASDVTIVATSLLTLWGVIKKVYKNRKGIPQVPTIVIDKEV